VSVIHCRIAAAVNTCIRCELQYVGVDRCRCPLGSVGNPFPFVDVCIARANIYAENGYDILARGNSRSTTITAGNSTFRLLPTDNSNNNNEQICIAHTVVTSEVQAACW